MNSESPVPSPPPDAPDVLMRFFSSLDHLYALVDAARDRQIFPLLQATESKAYSLFTDDRAETLAEFSPYLVALSPDAPILEALVAHWGDCWGVYVTSDAPLESLLEHCQGLLWAETPDGRMLFRFYDPRVLHLFLPTCDIEQARRFFGPVRSFYAEEPESELISRFTLDDQAIDHRQASLGEVAKLREASGVARKDPLSGPRDDPHRS